ncbi:DEAD-box ATP-dependent RNA helicase [Ceratobasidium sp. 392]|nr:DEAD-box ATP-dependent RNA helicase [Ceratobasidium sp. 392]
MALDCAAYVPPHLRAHESKAGNQSNRWSDSSNSNAPPRCPEPFGEGMHSSSGSSWTPRGASTKGFSGSTGRSTSSSWSTPPLRDGSGRHGNDGYGYWRESKDVTAPCNPVMERERSGDIEDPLKQRTGINFDKYEDIPIEATGASVPEPVNQFTNPLLDPVLLDNIQYARYSTPTPVHSIPMVAAGRDLMAYTRTGSSKTSGFLLPILSTSFAASPRPLPVDPNINYVCRAYPTASSLAPTCELVLGFEPQICRIVQGKDMLGAMERQTATPRGLDILNVAHVVNDHVPSDINDYVHRIGCTGRASNIGTSTAFFNRGNNDIVRELVGLLREHSEPHGGPRGRMLSVAERFVPHAKTRWPTVRSSFHTPYCRDCSRSR